MAWIRVWVQVGGYLPCPRPVPPRRLRAGGEEEVDREGAVSSQDQGGPTVRRRLLGSQLRGLREEAGISRAAAAAVIRGSESKISRLEGGKVSFREADVRDLLTHYGVAESPIRAAVLASLREANALGWWRSYNDVLPTWFERYVGLEAAASLIRSYEAQFVPGLLQTEDYARAITRAGQVPGRRTGLDDEIDRRVALRASRQQILDRSGIQLWAVIDEGALRRPIGGQRVMRDQLDHLLELREAPNVTIQVMPFGFGGHVAQVGAFTLLRFTEHDLPDMVYLEHLTGALYLDKRVDVDRYQEVFIQLALDSQLPPDSAKTLLAIRADHSSG